MPINVGAFSKYTDETRLRLLAYYPFYPLSPSVHKMLIHGASIIEHTLLPIGMMSEEVQERRNKSVRKFREHHSRKFSRLTNIEDVFKRLMLTSDPVVSLQKIPRSISEDFSEEVQMLLNFD